MQLVKISLLLYQLLNKYFLTPSFLLIISIEQNPIFKFDRLHIYILHQFKPFQDLSDFFWAINRNYRPFVAVCRYQGHARRGFDFVRSWRFFGIEFASDQIDFHIFNSAIHSLNNGNRDEAVYDLSHKWVGLDDAIVVFVKFFRSYLFLDCQLFRQYLTSIPNKLNSVLFSI